MTNQTLTDITLIVDASPSMMGQTNETIAGVNAFVQSQLDTAAEAKQAVKVNLVTFSTGHKRVESLLLNLQNYQPQYGNGTGLYDAVGNTINETGARLRAIPEASRPGKVLVVIVTDGEENTSRSFTKEQVTAMIKRQQDEYLWDFVFMGANQDAWQVGTSFGILGNKINTYVQNNAGTAAAFGSLTKYAGETVKSLSAQQALTSTFNASDVAAQQNAGLDVSKLSVPDALKSGF
jgi:uncharacterized protein YegL